MNLNVERIFHPTLKFHYAIINKETWEVLAESDYYDYLEILLRELKTLHKGFMDTDNLFIGQRTVNKELQQNDSKLQMSSLYGELGGKNVETK